MNGRERILASLSGQKPDRVPLYIHAINEVTIKGIAKLSPAWTKPLPEKDSVYDYSEAEAMTMLDALFFVHEQYGVDGITTFDIFNLKPIGNDYVECPFKVGYKKNPYGLPMPETHPIKTEADLDGYTPPVPTTEDHLLLHAARERFKGEKALFWMLRGAFVRSWRLMGMENFMLNMYDNPALIHRVCTMVTEFNLGEIELLVAAGLDVLIVEDDIADKNGPVMAPDHFMEFINPYNRQLVEKAHSLGLKVMRHSDGNLWPLLDMLLETGYDGLNPLEPQADMDLARVKEYTKGKITLMGNIDCQELLATGTKEEVAQAVKAAIDSVGQDGRLIICSSNSLHPGVDPANCIAMFEATHEYGSLS